MKFASSLIFGAMAAFVHAAPAPETKLDIDGTLIPTEAVIGGLSIPDDVFPIFNYENKTATVVFLNATILTEAKESNTIAKRDLNYIGEEFSKRDAEAEPWHWVGIKTGQPFFKRDADADADAWHWVGIKTGQPFFKRSADPWHWVSIKTGQPMFKRDAEASAEPWHWVSLKPGQPMF